ncbi:MAG TPA: adenylyl-sulfate kinase [Terracidiphilus sp.]
MISELEGIGEKLVPVERGEDQAQEGLAVWFTGLSGAGKTTICRSVRAELSMLGFRVEVLDADIVRKQFWPDLGFSKADRDENIRRIGSLAHLLTRNGIIALVAAISPYRAARNEVRDKICRFLEVHVDAPLHVCEERDPKGLYRRARAGDLHGFTGIDDPYEPPLAPEVRCATDRDSVNTCRGQVVSAILKYLS